MLPIKEFRGRRTGTTPTWTYSTFSTEPQIERPRSTSLPRIDRTSSEFPWRKDLHLFPLILQNSIKMQEPDSNTGMVPRVS